MAFTKSHFTASAWANILYNKLENILSKLLPHIPGANELTLSHCGSPTSWFCFRDHQEATGMLKNLSWIYITEELCQRTQIKSSYSLPDPRPPKKHPNILRASLIISQLNSFLLNWEMPHENNNAMVMRHQIVLTIHVYMVFTTHLCYGHYTGMINGWVSYHPSWNSSVNSSSHRSISFCMAGSGFHNPRQFPIKKLIGKGKNELHIITRIM